MFSFLKKSRRKTVLPNTDIHSHLLPGIDDGVQTLEQSTNLIRYFSDLGYQKLITTPHIRSDVYANTPSVIRTKLKEVKKVVLEAGLTIQIEAAAEYYFDEHFTDLVVSKAELLTFGDNYILFETGFISEPLRLRTIIVDLIALGYSPVLAHPERYIYYHQKPEDLQDLIDRGVLLQLNINSITGYYSKEVKKTAEKLIDNQMVHFIGSDCHNKRHFDVMREAFDHKLYKKIISLKLLNNTL